MRFVVRPRFMRNTLFLTLLLSLLAVGCGRPHPKSGQRTVGDLVLEVWVDRHWVNVGGTVRIQFTVENHGEETQVFELKDQSVMDICVRIPARVQSENDVVTYWSDTGSITPEQRRVELGPGESKSITMQWEAPEEADARVVEIGGILREGEEEDRWRGTALLICVGTSEGACYP